jgi:hypothetical protein
VPGKGGELVKSQFLSISLAMLLMIAVLASFVLVTQPREVIPYVEQAASVQDNSADVAARAKSPGLASVPFGIKTQQVSRRQISWIPVLSYLVVYSPILAVLLAGIVVSGRAYGVKPSRPRAIGLIGFVMFLLMRVVSAVGTGILSQLRPTVTPGMLRAFYLAVELLTAGGMAGIVYAYRELSRD